MNQTGIQNISLKELLELNVELRSNKEQMDATVSAQGSMEMQVDVDRLERELRDAEYERNDA